MSLVVMLSFSPSLSSIIVGYGVYCIALLRICFEWSIDESVSRHFNHASMMTSDEPAHERFVPFEMCFFFYKPISAVKPSLSVVSTDS